jgi:hypothetical protein
MGNEKTAPLEKNTIPSIAEEGKATSGCCGGTPVSNGDACCKLDEEKKAEGEAGCGCNTAADSTKSSCC